MRLQTKILFSGLVLVLSVFVSQGKTQQLGR